MKQNPPKTLIPSHHDKSIPNRAAGESCDSGACGCAAPGAALDRRTFLKAAGLGAAWISSEAGGVSIMAGPFAQPASGAAHFVPADKKLTSAWTKSLFEQGARRICRGKELDTIGMPIGGVAAGQLYLLGDGTLGYWELFNARDFTGYGATNWQYRTPPKPVDQGFAVVVREENRTRAKRLAREDFPNAEFVGEYPIGWVRYPDPTFPVTVEMEAFSPFIPLNAKDSSLPATLFHLTVENTSKSPVQAQLLGWLENAVCFHSDSDREGLRRNRIIRDTLGSRIDLTAEEAPKTPVASPRETVVLADFEGPDYGDWKVTGQAFGNGPARGTLPTQQEVSGFQGKGLVNTYLGKDVPQGTLTSPPFNVSRRFINFLVGGGSHKDETCINLLVDGKVVRSTAGQDKETLRWHSWNVTEFEGRSARIEIVDRNSAGWGHINIDQIELGDERKSGAAGPLPELADYGSMTLACAAPTVSGEETAARLRQLPPWAADLATESDVAYSLPQKRCSALLTQPVSLAPGEKHTVTFVLSWYFPNRPEGRGQAYANWFPNAAGAARYVLKNKVRLAEETRLWHATYYDSTLPRWLLDRVGATVCNLATGTCQWWKNGRFWGWEGVGCCAGTCTHVWNYEHAMARLFPELERSVREMQDFGEGFDERSGLVGFRSNRAYAADGQCGTILKAYREHLLSPDDAFLKRNWPKIKKALEFSIRQDGNDDGLIENSQHNTYDINFHGPNTFVGSLYLAALRAGEMMARRMDDVPFADRVKSIFEKGSQASSQQLWNGEYFIQKVDLDKYPKDQYGAGCLSDQMFGQGWSHQLGLGYIYPEDKVRQTLASVWKYNWAPDVGPQNARHKPERWFITPGQAGLFTCTWPKSKHLAQGVRYKNEIWTGIEYQVAGHMIWEGMLQEGLAIMRAIHDRYDPAQHNPYNEIECGDHYARALASWGAFIALAGFEHNGPDQHLGFAPRLSPEDFRTAFTTATGWGTLSQTRQGNSQTEQITPRWGTLTLRTVAFSVPKSWRQPKTTLRLQGQAIPLTQSVNNGRLTLQFNPEVTVPAGQTLEVRIDA